MAKAHAVFLASLQSGHINPMLELAQKLVTSFGFKISFVLTPEWVSKIGHKKVAANVNLVTFSGDISLFELTAPPDSPIDSMGQLIHGLDPPVTCLVCDSFIGCSEKLGNMLEIPRAAFWSSTAMSQVMCSYITDLLSKGYLPISANPEDTSLITFMPEIKRPITRRDLPLAFVDAENTFLHSFGESVKASCREAHAILLNTVEEFEQHTVGVRRKNSRYFPVGPLIPIEDADGISQLTDEDRACLTWLDAQTPSSVLYVAFGSYVSLPVVQVENIAHGLELSKQPFLWAIRKSFVANAPEGFLESLRDRFATTGQGLIVEWTPQAKVLAHSSVGGFFTHCGWNSTMEALLSEVPMLCWPCAAEQNLNSYTIVEEWKIGLKVGQGRDGNVNKEDIAQLVSRLMTGDEGIEMRSKIQGFKELIKGAFIEGGSSYRNLSNFVDSLEN